MKLTPRQRAAIAWPLEPGHAADHPRYHRVIGGWQSILTFDLEESTEYECACQQIADNGNHGVIDEYVYDDCPYHQYGEYGRRAFWHARATTYPAKPLADWTADEQRGVKRVLQRLLKRVGDGDVRIDKGSEDPPSSIHFFKRATDAEIGRCLRERKDTGGNK